MPKVNETTTITVDGTVFAVENMSDQIRNTVRMMDEWRQLHADHVSQATMVQAALRDLQNNLYVAIKKQMEEAAKKEAGQQDPQTTPVKPDLEVVSGSQGPGEGA